MRKANGTLSDNSAWVFADAPTGGAGYGTGVDIHITSGRQWIGTDTCGCYVRDPGDTKWTPVFTTSSIADPTDYATWNTSSTNCIRGKFAPSDKNRLYTNFNGRFYRVDFDPAKALGAAGAITATKWNLAVKRIDGGANFNRWWTCSPSVHPTDKNIVLAGTSNDGVYYTTDGGANVTSITIPACTACTSTSISGVDAAEVGRDQYMTWIDQGNPLYCYIFVQGTGLYRSTTGVSGTFSQVTGGPTAASCMVGASDGTIWITGDHRFTGGLWNIARGSSSYTHFADTKWGTNYPYHIAVDPTNINNILVGGEQTFYYSSDLGANWTTKTVVMSAGGDCTWRYPLSAPKTGANCAFDPLVAHQVLCPEGFGAMRILDITSSNTPTTTDYSAGMEQKIDVDFLHIPENGRNYVWGMDLPLERFDSLTTYTNIPHRGPNGVEIGGQADYAADNYNFVAQAVGSNGSDHSYSTDGGNTWAQFSGAYPSATNAYGFNGDGPHGCIAVGNQSNIVIAPTNAKYTVYTKDGGATWNPVLLSGSKDYQTNGAYFIRGRVLLTSDKTRPGTFAMVTSAAIPGTSTLTSPYCGLWVTTDGGDNWTQKQVGIVGHNGMTSAQVQAAGYEFEQRYKCRIAYVPGYSQELLYTPYDTINSKFFYSTNDGATFTEANSLIRNVKRFAFGKPLTGQTRPAVYFYGLVNSVGPAMWVTFDWFVSFTQIAGQHPGGYPSNNVASGVGADMSVFGRVFSTIEGRGSVYGTYRDVAHGT